MWDALVEPRRPRGHSPGLELVGMLSSYQARHLSDYQAVLKIFSPTWTTYIHSYQVTLKNLERICAKWLTVYQVVLKLSGKLIFSFEYQVTIRQIDGGRYRCFSRTCTVQY